MRIRPLLICSILIAIPIVTPLFAASPQSEGFKKLRGDQIRKAFTGKELSDGVHFAYRYAAGGKILGTKMGKPITDKWAVTKDKLCVTDRFGENCYDVWTKGAAVKFTIDGSDPVVEGFLK
jgi:hypothetical protein